METRRNGKQTPVFLAERLLEFVRSESEHSTRRFLDLYRQSRDSKETGGVKRYPSSEELAELNLTSRSWLALTEMESIPGGAGGPSEIILEQWGKAFLEHWPFLEQGGRLHIIAAIHGAFPPQLLMQTREGMVFDAEMGEPIPKGAIPADRPYTETMYGASCMIHAECSCGASKGNSVNIRRAASENVRWFLSWLAESGEIGSRVVIHPIEAVMAGFDLKEGRQDTRFLVHEALTTANLGSSDQPFTNPSRTRRDQLISGEQLDEILLRIMTDGDLIDGTFCVDSRQGFLTPPSYIKPIELKDLPQDTRVREDWQGTAHAEPFGMVIVDREEEMLGLAYGLLTQQYYLIRRHNLANRFGSPSIPLLLNISSDLTRGTKGEWLRKTLHFLLSAMDSEIYRTSLNTGPNPVKTFIRGIEGGIMPLKLGNGFKLFVRRDRHFFAGIQPGILIFPPFAEEQRGQVWPLTRRGDLTITD